MSCITITFFIRALCHTNMYNKINVSYLILTVLLKEKIFTFYFSVIYIGTKDENNVTVTEIGLTEKYFLTPSHPNSMRYPILDEE